MRSTDVVKHYSTQHCELAEDLMNAKRRRHFARRLNAERKRLSSALQVLKSDAERGLIEAAPESDAPSVSLSDEEAAEATASIESEQLREIDAAIARLRDDSQQFGRCVVCGQEIPKERLELAPWTQRCLTHAGAARLLDRSP